MHIWKTIKALPDCTPIPYDQAVQALGVKDPRALLLRLHAHATPHTPLLEQCEPSEFMRESKAVLAKYHKAGRIADPLPLHQYEVEWAPVTGGIGGYINRTETWPHLAMLKEQLLALRVELRLESLRAARRARLAKTAPVVTKTSPAPGEKKNGRKPLQLRLGITAFYLKRRESGEVAILLPGAISVFMEELRRHVNDPEVYDETKAHLRKLTKKSRQWRVFVHDPEEIDGKPRKSNEKPGGYEQSAVSAILTALRAQYPVE